MKSKDTVRFVTPEGMVVPAVDAATMRRVDAVAETRYGLTVLQMMEHAGAALAGRAEVHLKRLDGAGPVVVLAGRGGNGGGGLCAARHLLNRGYAVQVLLAEPPERLAPAPAAQWRILTAMGVRPVTLPQARQTLGGAAVILDALLGYSLRGAPRPPYADLIEAANEASAPVLSLDLPSGRDATTGAAGTPEIQPVEVLTLALPKTGLWAVDAPLWLADIGIPLTLYRELGLVVPPGLFRGRRVVALRGKGGRAEG